MVCDVDASRDAEQCQIVGLRGLRCGEADGFGNFRLLAVEGLRSAAASWRALFLGWFFMIPALLFDRFVSELGSVIRSCISSLCLGSELHLVCTVCADYIFSVVQLRVTRRRKSSKK